MESKLALAGLGEGQEVLEGFKPIPAPPSAFPGCFSLRNIPSEGCKWGWSSWMGEFEAGEDEQRAEPAGRLSPWIIIPMDIYPRGYLFPKPAALALLSHRSRGCWGAWADSMG